MTRKQLEEKAYNVLHPATTFEEKLTRLHNWKTDFEKIQNMSREELYKVVYQA